MNEASVRLALHHALQWRGYWPKHDSDGRKYPVPCVKCHRVNWLMVTPEIKGLPDTNGRHPRFPSPLIEVKAVKATERSFAFNSITPEQREYLSAWAKEGGGSYLCLGKIVPMGSKEKIRQILVIPWLEWLKIEDNYDKSIPWDYALYEKQPSLPRQSDLMSLVFSWWHLVRTANEWHFPDDHPLSVIPEIETPFFKKGKL